MSAPSGEARGLGGRALILGAANAFDYAMQFLLPVVLARTLDAASFGQYRLLWLAVGTVMAIAPLGIPQGLFYYLPRAAPAEKRLYIHHSLLWLAIGGLVGAWAVSPWNPFLPGAMVKLSEFGALVPAFVALWVTSAMLDMLLKSEERLMTQATIQISLASLRAITLAVGAIMTGDLSVLLWLLVALVVLKIAILLAYIARHHGLGGAWLERKVFATQFKHCAPFGLSGSLYGLRSQSDQWVAASIFALHNFAAFSIAAVLGPIVSLFRMSVNDAFLPSMSRLHAVGDMRGVVRLNSRANLLAATFLAPLLAFAFAFAEDLIGFVYTSTYVDAAPVMRLYAVGMTCGIVEIGSFVLLLHQGSFALSVNAIALALSVALSWVGALHFGMPGAALGSVVAIYLDRYVHLRRVSALTAIPMRELQDWRALGARIGAAALSAGFAWLVVHQAMRGAPPLERVALGGFCLAALYGTLLLGSRSGRAAMSSLLNLGNRA